MMNGASIVSVSEPLERNPKWRHVTIRRGDPPVQERAICFQGGETLVPGPLPEGWSIKESERGPVVEAPRQTRQGGGGGNFAAAFRNTKEGHFYEQDRMDRRTAMMKSSEIHAALKTEDLTRLFVLADKMYEWLRKGA